MRANIAGLIVLAGFLALQTSFVPGPAVVGPEVISRPLTQAEMDCTVGGKASCADVAGAAMAVCLIESGVDITDPEAISGNVGTLGVCAAEGLWAGFVCSIDWLYHLIF